MQLFTPSARMCELTRYLVALVLMSLMLVPEECSQSRL